MDALREMRNPGRCCGTKDRVSKPPQEGRRCSKDAPYVTSVAILLMQDIRPIIIAQLRSLPCNVEG